VRLASPQPAPRTKSRRSPARRRKKKDFVKNSPNPTPKKVNKKIRQTQKKIFYYPPRIATAHSGGYYPIRVFFAVVQVGSLLYLRTSSGSYFIREKQQSRAT